MRANSVGIMSKNKSVKTCYQANIKNELIRALYQRAHTALIGVTTTATGIAAIFFNEVSDQRVVIWLLAIYSLTFIRYLSIKKFKALDQLPVDIVFWGWLFVFFTFLSGLTWGAASIIFFTPDNLPLFNILALIVITLSIGSLVVLSAFPSAYYSFVIPAMLPMIWRYLGIDEQYYEIFGALLIVFYLALFSILRANHSLLRDSIVLRFKNVDLIDQLTEQKEKAEQANISKTKFLASASHDMRQPIHAMGLFLGVLEDRVEKKDQKIIVQKIQKSNNALSGLLDSLLDISKLDAGVIKIVPQPFSLGDLFGALNNEFQAVAKEKNLQIKFVYTKRWVNSDYRIVERIMRNLISNAIRYTETGRVLIGCRSYRGKTIVAVYDTGIGIPEVEMQDIFREFYQLHNPERDRSKGLGLGLAIVERMAKLLDLPLHIKSTSKKGSVFGFIIPVIPALVPATTKTVVVSNALYFDNKRVLVVDDEAEIRESLAELLRGWHCDVVVAASGAEALQALQKHNGSPEINRPDIILADYRLRDDETGAEVVAKINAMYFEQGVVQAIPAVIITGDTAPDRIKEAERSGYKILHKPVPPSALKLLLAEILD
ncbi:Sensory box histidine kinase/response regulator [hydrothermal vent metagenome]|uniref:histidine kinase n=1 Tax=hydrothermal vent metagenome TaxID=652676 RepID=A0A3B0WDJ8_9ZZZZ